MAIRRIARQLGDIRWADTKSPTAIRSLNPRIHRPAVLILDFYETSGFGAGRSVEHDINKHGLIMPRVLYGSGVRGRFDKMLKAQMSVAPLSRALYEWRHPPATQLPRALPRDRTAPGRNLGRKRQRPLSFTAGIGSADRLCGLYLNFRSPRVAADFPAYVVKRRITGA